MCASKRLAVTVGLLAVIATGFAATAPGVHAQQGVVGHLYVDNNINGPNTVSAFNRNVDGTLSLIPGSPFSIGGQGVGHGLSSQGPIQLSTDGRYLLAADTGSNQISVLKIKSDGSLRTVSGGPVFSGGVWPVSIGIHENLVYVANNGGTPNISGFTLNAGGHLRPLAGSTQAIPSGYTPGDVLFNGTGANLVVTLLGPAFSSPAATASYVVGQDGRLTAPAGSPFHVTNAGTIGAEFNPTDPSQLFVSNAHDGPGAGSISQFSVAADGTVTQIGSPTPDLQTAPCWVNISGDGRYLFTTNTGSSSISSYSLSSSLTLIGSTTLKQGTGAGAIDLSLDPTGSFLYVTDSGLKAVSAFSVSNGTLTELTSSPFSTLGGGSPSGIVVD